MEKEKNNRGLKILVVILILLVLGLSGYIVYDKVLSDNEVSSSEEETSSEESNSREINDIGLNDTFSLETESGIVEVIGYAKQIERNNGYEGTLTDEIVNYVFFEIIDTKSEAFKQYILNQKGNAFVSINDDNTLAIGLGCNTNGIINYYNSSNEYGFSKQYSLSSEDSLKILNSTKENPIVLKLERLELFGGKGAPTCYSHITYVQVE